LRVKAIKVGTPQTFVNRLLSIVSSRLDYCNSVLYGAPTSTIVKLQRMHNCLARIVLQQRNSCRAQPFLCPLLKSLHWLPDHTDAQRIDFKLATLVYKTQTTSQPEYIRQLISSQHSGSSMSLHSSSTLGSTYSNRIRQSFFQFGAPAIWNNLPTTVLEVNSLPVFRRRIKSHLFTAAFDTN